MRSSFTTFLLVLAVTGATAQVRHPRASTPASITQSLGLSEIRVVYSRPRAQGRRIMGELVPYGRIWRVGANESTKVIFTDSVVISGNPLPPGQYALYAIPDESHWTLIIHNNTSHWGDGRTAYDPKEDALRFEVRPTATLEYTDVLTLAITPRNHEEAEFTIQWERTRIGFLIHVNTRTKMLKEIEEQIRLNPTAATFYESARYFQEQGIFPDRARRYLIRAEELAGDQYYIHRVRALVEAQLGNYAEAIQHAEKSKTLAAKEGKDEFVRMNDRSIVEWQAKK